MPVSKMSALKAYLKLTSAMFAVSFSIVAIGGVMATILYGVAFSVEGMLYLLKQSMIAGAGTGATCFAIAALLPRRRCRK